MQALADWAERAAVSSEFPPVEPGMDLGDESSHIRTWFEELSRERTYTVIAGMGGGGAFPNPISWSELQAWAYFNNPTPWEIRALKQMDAAWLAAKNGNKTTGSRNQGRGEYCGGRDIEECAKVYGAALDRVCATCPD